MAIAVQWAARKLKLSIPGDLALVGFDNLDISAHLDTPLTTIAQPVREQGVVAGRMLAAMLDGGSRAVVEDVVLPTRLVVRGSTGVPSSRTSIT